MTIQIEFTPETLNELKYQRFRHLVPLVQRRMEALLLKAQEAHFRDHPPATIKPAQHEVEVITGVVRRETQIREFLKKLDLRCRKLGTIPA